MVNQKLYEKRAIICLLLVSLALSLPGCATVNVPNVGEKGYALEDDERRLFKRSEEACEVVDETDEIYPDPELEKYLTGLARKLVPETVSQEQRNINVRVLNDPSFNAFAFPNGRIFVNVGTLAAVDNEAQLATLLAHELTHVTHRHSLKQFRSLKNKSAFMSVIDIPLAIVGGTAAMMLGRLGMLSSIYGYSQLHEYEADENGFEIIVRNGYDAREAPKMFENLLRFLEAEEIKEAYFFSTHPNVKARVKNFSDLLIARNFQPHNALVVDTPEFQKYAYKIYTVQINLCIEKGMFKTAEQSFELLSERFADRPETFFLGGEIYRLRQDHGRKDKKRDKTQDYPKARDCYDQALALDPNFVNAVVGKAKVLEKMKKTEEARELFKKYLELAPQALDRLYIENFIKG